jgi:hypothetical protein
MKAVDSIGTGVAATVNPVTAAIAAVPAAFGLIQSIRQRAKAREIERNNHDPGFTPDPYLKNNLALAENQYAQKGLPGADLIGQQMDQSTATGLNSARTLTNSTDFSNTIASITGNRMAQDAQLGIAGAEQDAADMGVLMNANLNSSTDFLRAEELKRQRYLQAAAGASSYRGAANIGQENALKDLGTIGVLTSSRGISQRRGVTNPNYLNYLGANPLNNNSLASV